ncbi:hypothetical protein ACTND8_08120 [Atopobiaceae bacterium HCP3S3_F7]|uniref:hypothetical protein n=1 Tax=Collinsella sp. Sow4_E3 TaxID=3438776 RepID=UPI003F8DBC15
MTTNTTTAQLDNVAFGFAEGTLSPDGAKAYTWHAANAMLAGIQAANPETIIAGAYTKVDVVVTWEDGETYALRYDVDHNAVNLGQRIVDGARGLADFYRESGGRAEDVEEFLTNRDFNGAN